MKPTNGPARKAAIARFMGLFILSLLAVALAVYFLSSTPAGIYKKEARVYKAAEAEQAQLLDKIEGMTRNLKDIHAADEKYLNSNNDIEKGSLLGNLQEYLKNINDALTDVKKDSLHLSSGIGKRDSYNYIVAFNAILAYRNTINSLQKSLAEKGGDANELLKLKSALDGCTVQLEIYKQMAANKPAPVIPPSSSGGGAAAKDQQIQQLQQQLQQSQADLANCQKSKASSPASVPSPGHGGANLEESKKAVVLFDAAQELYTKAEATRNMIERRGVLYAARQLFEKSRPSYPDADKLNKAVNQIDLELKRLSNMG